MSRINHVTRLGVSLFLLILSMAGVAKDRPIIKVGGYEFPPFVVSKNNAQSGITFELIEMLNHHQNDVTFKYIHSSPKRRYFDFKEKRFDVIFFESIMWGWENYDIEASKVFLTGGEVYIANKIFAKDQRYFDTLKGKSLVGVLGYHYGFANFNSDTNYLATEFNMRAVSSPESIIYSILSGKSDIGIVTESYLRANLTKNSEIQKKILVSTKKDQDYRHTVLVRKNGQISVNTINHWLTELKETGKLKKLFSQHNLHQNIQ